jgi:hypothetical protein
MNRLSTALALGLGLVTPGPGYGAPPSPFDPPSKTVHTLLPRDRDNPQSRPKVTCAYFPRFMVKEIDLGEVGASQLSVLTGSGSPPCRQANAPGERVVSPTTWSGYFAGAKGDYVIFTADDGWNGGMGFAVFSAQSGRKLFDDTYKTRFQSVQTSAAGLVLRYRRVYAAKCSIAADAAGCWAKVRKDTGLSAAAPPDCRAAYAREARRTPKLAAQVRGDPTVIDYEALVTLQGGHPVIRPASGPPADCRLAD